MSIDKLPINEYIHLSEGYSVSFTDDTIHAQETPEHGAMFLRRTGDKEVHILAPSEVRKISQLFRQWEREVLDPESKARAQ